MPATYYTHEQFYRIAGRRLQKTARENSERNLVILSAVNLYFEHKYNTAYLNAALDLARATAGLRVNAVKSFLTAMTGAKLSKGAYAKRGKLDQPPAEFYNLTDWIDWADREAPEPEFDAVKAKADLVKLMERRARIARENGATDLAAHIERAAREVAA